MELKEFVKQTLLSVTDGVYEASGELQQREYNKDIKRFFTINEHNSVGNCYINFDVAVTLSKESKGAGKIIVPFANFSGGVKQNEEKLSRVQFKVLFINYQ